MADLSDSAFSVGEKDDEFFYCENTDVDGKTEKEETGYESKKRAARIVSIHTGIT